MRIAVAQMASLKGDIPGNLARHERLIGLAAAHGAELLVFPELSVSQYEPLIAVAAAMNLTDPRFQPLQRLADAHRMTMGVDMPLRSDVGVLIALLLFAPEQPRRVYAKHHLHPDEEPYFAPGAGGDLLASPGGSIAFAICYELSVAEHAQAAHAGGAAVYLASVAKTLSGVEKAHERLAAIARDTRMTVFMANCVGECEGKPAGGGSAIWDAAGRLLARLDAVREGLLLYDPAQPERRPEAIQGSA